MLGSLAPCDIYILYFRLKLFLLLFFSKNVCRLIRREGCDTLIVKGDVMEANWIQVLVITFGNLAWIAPIFFWVRLESRTDARHFDQKLEAMRLHTDTIVKAIHEEIKDFHGRLCAIEANKNKGG